MKMIDLSKEVVRHGGGIQPGSTAEAMALGDQERAFRSVVAHQACLIGSLVRKPTMRL